MSVRLARSRMILVDVGVPLLGHVAPKARVHELLHGLVQLWVRGVYGGGVCLCVRAGQGKAGTHS
jgi:hypothetical protein